MTLRKLLSEELHEKTLNSTQKNRISVLMEEIENVAMHYCTAELRLRSCRAKLEDYLSSIQKEKP